MDELFTLQSLAALATLSLLEIVLGIDNIVFLAILTGKLPEDSQPRARFLGLMLAAVGRVALLLAISWVITLDSYIAITLPFDLPGVPAGSHELTAEEIAEARRGETLLSVKDLILIAGGLFLLAKSTMEINHDIEGHRQTSGPTPRKAFFAVLLQILAIDMVFSLDSVLTAVGMVNPDEYHHRWAALAIMIAAIILAIGVMMAFSGPISRFVNQHPSVKMLALSFLILIGVVLVAEGLHSHVPRGYIYFSMGFSLFVEMLNLRAAARREASSANSAG